MNLYNILTKKQIQPFLCYTKVIIYPQAYFFNIHMMKTKQKRYLDMAVGSIAVLALVAVAGYAQAAGTYNFTIRGSVTGLDKGNKIVTVYPSYTTANASDDLAGNKTDFKVFAGSKFYKYDANGKKVRISLGNVPVQSEVVIQGTKRSATSYVINELTVNQSTFSLVGTVKKHDTTNKTISIEVSTSTYKESAIKGNTVTVYYGGDTKFYNSQLKDINSDELNNNSEKAKVTGIITNGWKYEAQKVIDGYEKAK